MQLLIKKKFWSFENCSLNGKIFLSYLSLNLKYSIFIIVIVIIELHLVAKIGIMLQTVPILSKFV